MGELTDLLNLDRPNLSIAVHLGDGPGVYGGVGLRVVLIPVLLAPLHGVAEEVLDVVLTERLAGPGGGEHGRGVGHVLLVLGLHGTRLVGGGLPGLEHVLVHQWGARLLVVVVNGVDPPVVADANQHHLDNGAPIGTGVSCKPRPRHVAVDLDLLDLDSIGAEVRRTTEAEGVLAVELAIPVRDVDLT